MESNDTADARTTALAGELRVLIGKLKRRLREQASVGDLPPSQLAVLRHLAHTGPSTVTALAQAEGIRPQSMGATVALLEAAGMVAGSPHPTDGRQTILSLTPSCRERIDAGRAARQDWLFHAIRSEFSSTEEAELARGVELMKRLTGAGLP
jgi:DNA-binding MarR family transcriptional regulator